MYFANRNTPKNMQLFDKISYYVYSSLKHTQQTGGHHTCLVANPARGSTEFATELFLVLRYRFGRPGLISQLTLHTQAESMVVTLASDTFCIAHAHIIPIIVGVGKERRTISGPWW